MNILDKLSTIKETQSFVDYINEIKPPNRELMFEWFRKYSKRIARCPGSLKSHQAWDGGYIDHLWTMISLSELIYNEYHKSNQKLDFDFGDVVLVILLHDYEKPFLYVEPELSRELAREKFDSFGFVLSDIHLNALKYAHGENDHFIPHKRVMNELAGILHAADVLSARTYHELKILPQDWYKEVDE